MTDSTTKYWAETECEHGKTEAHQTYIKDRRGNIGAEGPVCPGGSRVLMTPREVEWCERHNAAQFKDFPWCAYAAPDGPTSCNLVSQLLVDYPKEADDERSTR